MSDYSIQSISGKDRKALIKEAMTFMADPSPYLPKKGSLTRYSNKNRDAGIIVEHKDVVFVEINKRLIPSLKLVRAAETQIPHITVDLGAIKFVTNGADIMRPGITKIDENTVEGGLVLIKDEKRGNFLAVGIAMYDAVDMKAMDSGKCIKNMHYLTDEWWNFTPSK